MKLWLPLKLYGKSYILNMMILFEQLNHDIIEPCKQFLKEFMIRVTYIKTLIPVGTVLRAKLFGWKIVSSMEIAPIAVARWSLWKKKVIFSNLASILLGYWHISKSTLSLSNPSPDEKKWLILSKVA